MPRPCSGRQLRSRLSSAIANGASFVQDADYARIYLSPLFTRSAVAILLDETLVRAPPPTVMGLLGEREGLLADAEPEDGCVT